MSTTALSPDPAAWRLSWIAPRRDCIVLHLEPVRRVVSCPVCGIPSARVHSRYWRRAWDLPWGKWLVQLVVHARRFFCDALGCRRRTFAEPFPNVLPPYARQTGRWRTALLELAHASNAEMAARVARLLGFFTSPDTLIRRQREENLPSPSPQGA